MELGRAQITVNAIVPTAWTAMTETIPVYAPLIGRDEFPPEVRREHALGGPEDCAPLVVFLASDAAAGVTGQAIGIGGDRLALYSHPAEIAHEFRDGGWTADAIAAAWASFEPQPGRHAASGAGPVVNVADLVAIDVHTHAERNTGEPQDPVTEEVLDAAKKYFGGSPQQPTAQEVADYYRERKMAAVIFTVDDEAGMGRKRLGNAEVLEAATHNPDVLIPFASVDPHKGKLAIREAREWIEQGASGFKFHPNTQAFLPNDHAFYRSTR